MPECIVLSNIAVTVNQARPHINEKNGEHCIHKNLCGNMDLWYECHAFTRCVTNASKCVFIM